MSQQKETFVVSCQERNVICHNYHGIPTTISNAYSVSTRMEMCMHHPQSLVDSHRDTV